MCQQPADAEAGNLAQIIHSGVARNAARASRIGMLPLVIGEDRERADVGRLKLTDGRCHKFRVIDAGSVIGCLSNDPGEKLDLLLVS